jgi:hypothetical protein
MAMSYQQARRIKNTGLKDLIAQNIVSGQGIGSAIGSSISQSFRAKATGFKEKFDPLNIAKKLTGNLGAAVLGRLTGRSKQDISYFAGGKRGNSAAGITQDTDMENMGRALYTNVSEGQRQRMRKGDSVTNVLAKLYNLMKKNYESEEKRRERTIKDKINEEDEKILRHKELMEAITGMKYTGKASNPVKKEDGGLLGLIEGMIDKLLEPFKWLIELKWLKEFASLESLATRILGPTFLGRSVLSKIGGPLMAIVGAYYAGVFLKDTEFGFRLSKEGGSEGNLAEQSFKNKQTDFSSLPLTQDQAKAILEQPESEAKKRDITSFGGIERIQAIAEGKPDPGGLTPQQQKGPVDLSVPTNETEQFKDFKDKTNTLPASIAEHARTNYAQIDPRRSDLVVAESGAETEGGAYVGGMHGVKKQRRPVNESTQPTASPVESNDDMVPTDAPKTAAFGVAPHGIKPASAVTPSTSLAPPSASMAPPMPNPLGEQVQKSISQNNHLLIQEPEPKLITIDNSKSVKMSGGGQGSGIIKDGTVDVRIDDPTLQKLQKQNYRAI